MERKNMQYVIWFSTILCDLYPQVVLETKQGDYILFSLQNRQYWKELVKKQDTCTLTDWVLRLELSSFAQPGLKRLKRLWQHLLFPTLINFVHFLQSRRKAISPVAALKPHIPDTGSLLFSTSTVIREKTKQTYPSQDCWRIREPSGDTCRVCWQVTRAWWPPEPALNFFSAFSYLYDSKKYLN